MGIGRASKIAAGIVFRPLQQQVASESSATLAK